jgi:MinD superfamily P-loop ATPase
MITAVAGTKGGAGKTLLASSLAMTVQGLRFIDCDVEEPNAHLYLNPVPKKQERVTVTVPRAKHWFQADLRAAVTFCPVNALAVTGGRLLVFEELCTGCGGCFLCAPPGTLTPTDIEIGRIKTGLAKNGTELVTGTLNVGSQRTGRVIRAAKQKIARTGDTLIDCPPGSSRPALEAIRGSSFCIIVTEATPFGLEDLKTGIESIRLLAVPFGVVINKCIGTPDALRAYCKDKDVPIVAELPFSKQVMTASSRGKTLPEMDSSWEKTIRELWNRIGTISS